MSNPSDVNLSGNTESYSVSYAMYAVNSLSVLLSYWDANGICKFANAVHLSWFSNESSGSYTYKDLEILIYRANFTTDGQLSNVLKGIPSTFEKFYLSNEGKLVLCKVSLTPHIIEEKIIGIIIQILPNPERAEDLNQYKAVKSINGDKRMERLVVYLQSRLQGPFPGIDDLADFSMVSKSKLKRDFKSSFNTTPFFLFRAQQMEYAKIQLTVGNFNKKQLAEMLGFSNLSNFYKCFNNHLMQSKVF